MPNKVAISNDIALPILWPPVVLTAHSYLGPTPPALPPPIQVTFGVATEIPVPMFWPPGMAMGQNKLTTTVVHKNLSIAQHGHDCGTAIVHVQILPGPLNTLTVLHILFSSRKVNFSSSTVLSQGKPTACATLISLPPAPMTTCMDPISPPCGSAPTCHLNTVVVVMSWADIIIGWAAIAANAAFEFVMFKLGGGTPFGGTWGALGKEFGKALLGKALGGGSPGELLAKNGIAVATGVAQLIFTDGPVDVKIGVGSPFLQVEAGVTRNVDGDYGVMAGGRAGDRSGEVSYDGKGGHWKTENGNWTGTDTSSSDSADERTRHSTDLSSWGAPL